MLFCVVGKHRLPHPVEIHQDGDKLCYICALPSGDRKDRAGNLLVENKSHRSISRPLLSCQGHTYYNISTSQMRPRLDSRWGLPRVHDWTSDWTPLTSKLPWQPSEKRRFAHRVNPPTKTWPRVDSRRVCLASTFIDWTSDRQVYLSRVNNHSNRLRNVDLPVV